MQAQHEELLADLKAWLDWQKDCGALFWPVEDWSKWTIKPSVPIEPKRVVARGRPDLSSKITRSSTPKKVPPVQVDKPKKITPIDVPKDKLSGRWGNFMQARPEPFHTDRVSKGAAGFREIREYVQRHYPTKDCMWGRGYEEAPVVLIEGAAQPLNEAGLQMLSLMREKVLNLSKEKMFWLPVYLTGDCEICSTIVIAQLNALQPKAALIMGEQPRKLFSFQDTKKLSQGQETILSTGFGEVAALATLHPNVLLEEPAQKRQAMSDLRNFRRVLQRLNIV